MGAIKFNIVKRDKRGRERAGIISTQNGTINTPAFCPVGTKAGVKGILPSQLKDLGVKVVLANTYHLYLQPGENIVHKAGGLAKFMGWDGPTITDSGGFQVFSLGAAFGKTVSKFTDSELEDVVRPTSDVGRTTSQHRQLVKKIDDEGVSFTSHIDGSLHRFTPERSVEIQHALGADIFFAFDECTSPTAEFAYQREAMLRTHKWAERSLKSHRQNVEANKRQAIFGIAQGGQFDDLRRESARTIVEMEFDGFGLGGSFSKKYGDDSLQSALEMLKELPETMPVHGLGIGEPGDILASIAAGVDLFDCVAPTRLGRHGSIYTNRGIVHLRNEKYQSDFTQLSECLNFVSQTSNVQLTKSITLAYVSHLFRSGEMLGQIIASLHNLDFILSLVTGARQAILNGRFEEYRLDFLQNYYHA